MADIICEGPITMQHLETILQDHFKTSNKIVKAQGEIISKGLGFTSDVMRVDLEWETKNGLPCRIIAKAPKIANIAELMEKFTGEGGQQAMDQSAKFVPMIHERECTAYKILRTDSPVPIPFIYGYWLVTEELPGLILMEDLGARAGIVDNVATGLTLNQWRNIVLHLADLHAWSINNDFWRDQVPDVTSLSEFFKGFELQAKTQVVKTKEKYPEYFSHVDQTKIAQEITYDNMMVHNTAHQAFMPDILQHGDTWVNNIMFEKDDEGKITDKVAAFIDWQICLRGGCVNDMCRLTSWCVNHEIRRAHQYEILKAYYDRLKSKAGSKLNATFDQIKDLYATHISLNGILGVFMVEFMLENIGKISEDPTGFRKKELLERAKAGYDDAAAYFGWSACE